MNYDLLNETKDAMKASIESGDTDKFVEDVMNICKDSEQKVIDLYNELKNEKDVAVLASRGIYQLTSEEKKYYDSLVENVKNAVSGIPNAIPETTWNRVFEDLVTDHPLLNHINFINTKSIENRFVVNTGISGVAGWGELCDAIDDEIESGFTFKAVTLYKLSAYMEVCKTIIDMGYEWIDRYVRMCLGEAIAVALEEAIINGTGSDQPLGLTKVIAAAGQTQTIPASDKTAVTITDLSATSLGAIAATLAQNANGGYRPVNKIVMVVNPADYYSKVVPAVRFQNAEGKWVEWLPFPVEIIMSAAVTSDYAVFFLDKSYTMLLGLGREGRLERSDDYKFYDDLICYKVKMVANGLPKDDNCSVVADISTLEPSFFTVHVPELETQVNP